MGTIFYLILVAIKNLLWKIILFWNENKKHGLWIIIVMMQYITNLPYHKVEETIVSQKILICHEKVECNLKTDGIQFFSFHNFYIFVCKLKQIYLYFSSRDVCYFLLKINEYIEKK